MGYKEKDMNTNVHSVRFNYFMSMILKISSYIFPLITLPYITRTIGAVGNGKISFATSVVSYFIMFAQLGIPTYGVRECARVRNDKEKLTKTVQEILIINTVSVIISYTVLIGCMLLIPKFQEYSVLIWIQSTTIILNMVGMEWLYQAIEQYKYITIRNVFFKIISIIMMFSFVHRPKDYVLYCGILVISTSGSYLLNLWNSKSILSHKTYLGEYNFKKHLRPIFVFFSMSIAVSIYTSLDAVMLGFFSNDKEVAFYALGTKIKLVLASTVAALGPVLLPRITYCLSIGEEKRFKEYINKSLHFVLLVALPFTFFFTINTPEVIQILGGEEYISAIPCMQIINFTIIPLGLGNVAASQILTPTNREKYTLYATIVGSVVDLLGNLILIPYYGAAGAALATVLTEWIVAIIQIKYAWDVLRDEVRKVHFRYIILSSFLSGAILIVVKNFICSNNAFIVIIITALVYFGIYSIALIAVKDELITDYAIPFIKKLLKKKN